MLVADVHVDELTGEIQVPASVEIPDRRAASTRDREPGERTLRRPRVEDVGAVELLGKVAVCGVEGCRVEGCGAAVSEFWGYVHGQPFAVTCSESAGMTVSP